MKKNMQKSVCFKVYGAHTPLGFIVLGKKKQAFQENSPWSCFSKRINITNGSVYSSIRN